MYMCRSLLIFSNVNFKMAARQPYWIFWFPDSNFSLALNINSKLKWHNTNISGRGRRLAGFDAPFNMGSAECKIEWNDNFDVTYLKN